MSGPSNRIALRSAHALRVHPQFALEMAGELMRQAESSVGRLRRIAREPGASAMERSMAENFAFKVYVEMIGKLQSMGYLPRIPTGVVAQVISGGDAIATYEQLAQRLQEIEAADRELNRQDPQRQQHLQTLLQFVVRGQTEAQIERMENTLPGEN